MIVAKLNWTDNSGNEQGFRIYRTIGIDPLAKLVDVPAGTVTYQDDLSALALAEGTIIGYAVSGFNSAGETALTPTVSGTIPAMLPNPPSGLIVQVVVLG